MMGSHGLDLPVDEEPACNSRCSFRDAKFLIDGFGF